MRPPVPVSPSEQEDEQPRPLPAWMHRYPGVEQFLEQPGDVLEGVSVEPPTIARRVYTMELYAGETIRAGERVRFDGEYAVRCSPGMTPLGIALTPAEPEESVCIQVSEAYFAH